MVEIFSQKDFQHISLIFRITLALIVDQSWRSWLRYGPWPTEYLNCPDNVHPWCGAVQVKQPNQIQVWKPWANEVSVWRAPSCWPWPCRLPPVWEDEKFVSSSFSELFRASLTINISNTFPTWRWSNCFQLFVKIWTKKYLNCEQYYLDFCHNCDI